MQAVLRWTLPSGTILSGNVFPLPLVVNYWELLTRTLAFLLLIVRKLVLGFLTRLDTNQPVQLMELGKNYRGERTGQVVRASDSESGDPGSILGRVGVLFP